MKKFLCVLLTIAMLLSSMVFVVSAAETEEKFPTEIFWNDCDGKIGGWELDAKEKTQGKASLSKKVAAGQANGGADRWHFAITGAPVDISNMENVVFDMYVSGDPTSVANSYNEFELSSSGKSDVAEIRSIIKLGDYGLKKQGWNTITIPLSDLCDGKGVPGILGNVDMYYTNIQGFQYAFNSKAVDYLRFYNWGAATISEEVVIKVDNVRFTNEDPGDVSASKKISANWTIPSISQHHLMVRDNYFRPIDITNYTYMAFDYYTSDASVAMNWCFEMSSLPTEESKALGSDQREYQCGAKVFGATGQWVTILLPITAFGPSYGPGSGPFDPTKVFRIGWFNTDGFESDHDVNIQFKNFRFVNGEEEAEQAEVTEGSISLQTSAAKWGDFGYELIGSKSGVGAAAARRLDGGFIHTLSFAPVNTVENEYNAVSFWLYVSDPAALNAANYADSCFELTSSGTYDRNEINWRMDKIVASIGEVKAGWNKVVLKFDDLSGDGDINYNAVNFIRFYAVGVKDTIAPEVLIAIDDVRLVNTNYVPPVGGMIGVVQKTFTAYKLLSKIPFFSRLFAAAAEAN